MVMKRNAVGYKMVSVKPTQKHSSNFNYGTGQAILNSKNGIGLSKPYILVDEMFEDILKDSKVRR